MSIPKITDYELQEKLGSGSYATVYKARHKKTQKFHAIKCVEKSSLSKSATNNLVTEIKLLKSLSHKHIVSLDDFFWDNKFIYIVLEYCNAGNLSTYIRSKKVLSETTCKYFLGQLAQAVLYMRMNDVSHFDLKPQNLLLSQTPNIILKVADFGFAQHLKLGETNYSLKGSPLYMAPEIVLKKEYDAKADLWSIGIILYECLFGRAPYLSKSLDELMNKIKRKEPIQIPTNSRITINCEDLLSRLLQHDPTKRISFQEFFEHPFIKAKETTSKTNLEKAISTITQAVDEDNKHNYQKAYHIYCQALSYFVAVISEETDPTKRQILQSRIHEYLQRAEEIKTNIISQQIENNDSPRTLQNKSLGMLEPVANFKQLYALSSSSPQIQNALDIGRQAEMYLFEKKFEVALELFTSSLGMLVPLLNNEPKSERRNLLHQQIEDWMKEAESIKSLLNAKDMENEIVTIYNCSLQ